MATTTAARVSAYLAGTGVVLGATELGTLISDADLWFTRRVNNAGVTWVAAGGSYNESLELQAKSLWVLSQVQFAPFSFTKGPESKTVQFGKAVWGWALNGILEEAGLVLSGGQAVKGIESGTDYSTEDDELHVLTIVTY